MPIDASFVGRTYASPTAYEVGREKIHEFADALGDRNPAYRGTDPLAPPTFGIVVAFGPMEAMLDDLGVPLSSIMHADQKFTAHRAIRPGDRLLATLSIETVRRVADTDLVATRTQITTEAGEPVCTATAKIVHREAE